VAGDLPQPQEMPKVDKSLNKGLKLWINPVSPFISNHLQLPLETVGPPCKRARVRTEGLPELIQTGLEPFLQSEPIQVTIVASSWEIKEDWCKIWLFYYQRRTYMTKEVKLPQFCLDVNFAHPSVYNKLQIKK